MSKYQNRHGDLFVNQIKEMPQGLKPYKGTTLAYGEATGHHHTLAPLKLEGKYMTYDYVEDASLVTGRRPVMTYVTGKELMERQEKASGFKMDFQGGKKQPELFQNEKGELFFACHNTTVLQHPEHGSIVIPPGIFDNTIQVEYVPQAAPRQVVD